MSTSSSQADELHETADKVDKLIAMHVDSDYMNYAKYGLLWNADACRHVKERTVEDVLREYGEEYHKALKSDYTVDPADIFRKYAAEIRQMMGGDVE